MGYEFSVENVNFFSGLFSFLAQKRVEFFLGTDASGVPVAIIYLIIIAQRKQLGTDGLQQSFEVSTRQIAAADGPLKQYIATNH